MSLERQDFRIVHDALPGTADYPFPFGAMNAGDVKAYIVNPALPPADPDYRKPAEDAQIIPAPTGIRHGGAARLATGGAGLRVEIVRETPKIQDRTYSSQARIPPESIEAALDRAMMIAQELEIRELVQLIRILQGEMSEAQNALERERQDRADADAILQQNIDGEEAARIAADGQLRTSINAKADRSALEAEIAARIQGDGTLRTAIADEASTRAAAVLALQQAVAGLVLDKLGYPPADGKTYAVRDNVWVQVDDGTIIEDGDGFFIRSQGVVYLKSMVDPNAPSRFFRFENGEVLLRETVNESVPSKFFELDNGEVILKGTY
ncbi:MAG: hypothetical protein LBE84_00175 [Planctomycetota bacterium]|jgi:hypothetical protein|nr:hypothetical protein [Planctomycetota bacterium]